ncbi:hypothetical protein AKG34_11445 [Peribacillus butanolivorans]|uniref:hypothetical protein n=1 Tax=Peribacillus butanolivorans TaxID=421767 RepID=UPI0006A6A272|nr:hypothetical protein AKG34_11445 [Peribacillus butanolivorans]
MSEEEKKRGVATFSTGTMVWLEHQVTLPFVGIDDFAFKKRMSYGTVFIDLKNHRPLDQFA